MVVDGSTGPVFGGVGAVSGGGGGSRLLRDYGSERFKVGEDDDGYAVYVKMRHYLRYLLTTKDDSPL